MLAVSTIALCSYTAPALRAAPQRASSVNMMAKSKAIPFLEEPAGLAGYVGDKGFDPMGFGSTNIQWMREAELKHGRLAMLAASGFIAVDLGITGPGAPTGLSSVAAHDAAVANGSMVMLLMLCSIFETVSLFATMQMLSGETDRQPGDFGIGLKYMEKDPEGMKLKEIQNGRLAMLAFSGMVTQSVLYSKGFPYF